MKQEGTAKNKKKLWLIIAIAAVLVAVGVAAALLLPGLLGGPGASGEEQLAEAIIYYNVDKAAMVSEETGLSIRELGADGYYHFRMAICGELKDVLVTNDKKLVNYMDTLDMMCPVLDNDGVVIDVHTVDQYFNVMKDIYVVKVEGNKITTNSSTAVNGMPMTHNATGIYDCRPGTENLGQTYTPVWMDKVMVLSNEDKSQVHIYVMDNVAVDGELAWRVGVGKYNSATGGTYRIPDENGVYTMTFVINGKVVDKYCKLLDKINEIDKINSMCSLVALQYDEDGYIIDWQLPASVLHGIELCKNYTVTALDNGTFSATYLLPGNQQGMSVEATYDDSCEIFLCCEGCVDEHQCEPIDSLQVGDFITCYTDVDGKPLQIYVGRRAVDSKMYYNLSRKYDSTLKETTRVPDEDGYYVYDMAVGGTVKQFKTKDKKIANFIDGYTYNGVGLKVSGNIIKKAYWGHCVAGYSVATSGRYVTKVMTSIISTASITDLTAVTNFMLSSDVEIYDISGQFGTKMGEKTELREGDKIVAFQDKDSRLSHVYVTARHMNGMSMAYNKSRMYDTTNATTTRKPDADGYYVYTFLIDGKEVTAKTKSKEMADFIDLQYVPVLGVKVSKGIITKACVANEAIPYGMKAYNMNRVANTKDNIISAYYISQGVRKESPSQYKLTSKTKIYNVSGVYEKHWGETTKLKADDQIQCVVDISTGEVKYAYVLQRVVKSDLYWHVARSTCGRDANGVLYTQRKPDADGYYVFQLYKDGKIVTYKTKDAAIAANVDVNTTAFGLEVKNGIITRAMGYACTPHFTMAASQYDVTKVTSKTIETVRLRASATNYGAEATLSINKNTKYIDLCSYSETYGQQVSGVKVGDRVNVYLDKNAMTTYCYIMSSNTREKGFYSYCDHCNKKVYWEAYDPSNIAETVHCYLTKDLNQNAAYTFGSQTDEIRADIVIDLNGKSFTAKNGGFIVNDKLTILDTVGTGKLIASKANIQHGIKQGGNIFVTEGATLTLLSGSIVDGNAGPGGVGSNISAYNATVNIKGGTITGGLGYLGTAIYHSGTKGGINISGGKITGGSVYAETTNKLTLSGKPVIDKVIVAAGNTIKLGTLKDGASVTVKADGVFTAANTASAAKFFKVAETGDAITVQGTALKYTNNTGAVIPTRPTAGGALVLDANNQGMCFDCGEVVTWEPVTAGGIESTGGHYYVASDFEVSSGKIMKITESGKVCFHLNDKTITIKAANGNFYPGYACTLNMLGNGTVKYQSGLGGSIFSLDNANINIYGGTYIPGTGVLIQGGTSAAKTPATTMPKLYFGGTADVRGLILCDGVCSATVTLADAAKVKTIHASVNTTLAVNKGFEGLVEEVILSATFSGNKLPEKNGIAYGDYTGSIYLPDGRKIQKVANSNQLMVAGSLPDKNMFDPESFNGRAYCPACDTVTKWTAHTGTEISSTGSHIYLKENIEVASGKILRASTGTTCFNLNGKTITITKAGVNIYPSSGVLNMLDTVGGGKIAYQSGLGGSLFSLDNATINFYGGTYTPGTGVAIQGGTSAANTKDTVKPKINIAGNTDIQGNVLFDGVCSGSVSLADTAKVSLLTVSVNTKLTVKAGWSGTVQSIDLKGGLVDDAVPAKNGEAQGAFTGAINLEDGRKLQKATDGNTLVAIGEGIREDIFAPDQFNGKAYCEACKKVVTWTKMTAAIGDVTASGHYYAGTDFETASRLMWLKNAPTVCFNLNGKTITGVGNAGSNANFYVASGTLNVMGDGTIQKSASIGGSVFSMDNTTVNIYGGTFIASPTGNVIQGSTLDNNATANVKPAITICGNADLQGEVKLAGACTGALSISDTVSIDKVTVSPNSKLTVAANFAGTVDKITFNGITVTEDVPAANAVALGSFTGKLSLDDGRSLVWAEGNILTAHYIFDPANNNGKALCLACGSEKTWTPITDKMGRITTSGGHYYVAADFTATAGADAAASRLLQLQPSTAGTCCIHLNGKTITCTDGNNNFYIATGGSTLNILGEGTIQKNANVAGSLFSLDASTLNLYGGTYIPGTGVVIQAGTNPNGSSTPVVNLYGDTDIQGTITRFGTGVGNVSFSGNASADKLIPSANALFTINSGWTGSLDVLEYTPASATQLYLPTANAVATGDFTGTVKLANGTRLYYGGENKLVLDNFKPAANEGKAYCQACRAVKTWEVMSAAVGDVNAAKHYYVAEGGFSTDVRVLWIKSAVNVCVNLNGQTITGTGTTASNANFYVASTGATLNVMGEGTVQKSNSAKGTVFSLDSTTLNLYGGTYISSTMGGTTIQGSTNGASSATPHINLYGNTDVKGEATLYLDCQGAISLSDNAKVGLITVSPASKLTIHEGWAGTVEKVDFKATLEATAVPAANGEATGEFTGTITLLDGRTLKYLEENRLSIVPAV